MYYVVLEELDYCLANFWSSYYIVKMMMNGVDKSHQTNQAELSSRLENFLSIEKRPNNGSDWVWILPYNCWTWVVVLLFIFMAIRNVQSYSSWLLMNPKPTIFLRLVDIEQNIMNWEKVWKYHNFTPFLNMIFMVLMLSLTPYANYRQTAFGKKQSFTLILLYVHTRGTYLFIYTTYIRIRYVWKIT